MELDNTVGSSDGTPTEDLDNTLTISEGIPTGHLQLFRTFKYWPSQE